MQLQFHGSSITHPTYETLQEYGTRRFNKLARYLPHMDGEHAIRISVTKQRHLFFVTVEIHVPEPLVVKVRSPDMRAAIDQAYSIAKMRVNRNKLKKRS